MFDRLRPQYRRTVSVLLTRRNNLKVCQDNWSLSRLIEPGLERCRAKKWRRSKCQRPRVERRGRRRAVGPEAASVLGVECWSERGRRGLNRRPATRAPASGWGDRSAGAGGQAMRKPWKAWARRPTTFRFCAPLPPSFLVSRRLRMRTIKCAHRRRLCQKFNFTLFVGLFIRLVLLVLLVCLSALVCALPGGY